MSKLEADIHLMSSFSKDFWATEMLGDNICAEDLLNIRPIERQFAEDEENILYNT